MKLVPSLLGLLLLLATPLQAAPQAPDEILAAVQTRLESGESLDELIDALVDLPSSDLNNIEADVEKAWTHLKQSYLSAFEEESKNQNSGTLRNENKKLVRQLRDDFHKVRRMGEGPMKEAIKKTSNPAIKKLREILVPEPKRILELAGPELQKQREIVLRLAKFRDGIREANVAIGEEVSANLITTAEKEIAAELSELDRKGLRIMEDNRKVAEKAELPEPERLGIEELNIMRLLVDLPALELDPKLCDASRGHSEDMSKLKFFSHTSPVSGKKTPSDRAAKAGTSGGGENIYMGSKSPKAANKGWFYSPGHHKNMFNGGYKRIGLGNYGSHWTQMFGG